MKLVEILARELADWPELATAARQYGRTVRFYDDGCGMGCANFSEAATDQDTAIVTRAMWEAERNRTAPDWSKAPEGATHYGPETDRLYAAWYKKVDSGWMMWTVDINNKWHYTDVLPPNVIVRPVEWDGTGLPHVGTKCEVEVYEGEWFGCTVVAHFEGRAVIVLGNRESAHICDAKQLRPIRTPEQAAAEEREREIMAIECVIKDAHYGLLRTDISPSEKARQYASALYDAGYRRQ